MVTSNIVSNIFLCCSLVMEENSTMEAHAVRSCSKSASVFGVGAGTLERAVAPGPTLTRLPDE